MEAILVLSAILIGAFTALVTFTLTFWSSDTILTSLAVYMLSGVGGSALILAPVSLRVWSQSRTSGMAVSQPALTELEEDQIAAA
jgi:hypothetical protein